MRSECLSTLVADGYKGLAARCVDQLVEWRQGITPSLESLLRNVAQGKDYSSPNSASTTVTRRSHPPSPLKNVVDLGVLQSLNRSFESAKAGLESVARSGNILALGKDVLGSFMRYVDAGVAVKPRTEAAFAETCIGLVAAHFFPSSQAPSQELSYRLRVRNVVLVHDLSKIEWDDKAQERTLPVPYDKNSCMVHNMVLGLRLIYNVSMLEFSAQNFEEGRVIEGLQAVGISLGQNPAKLRAELGKHSEAVFAAVSLVQPHFGAEDILRRTPTFQEADRRGYLLMSLLDTLTSVRIAATRSESAPQERLYVYGVGLAELLHNSLPSSVK